MLSITLFVIERFEIFARERCSLIEMVFCLELPDTTAVVVLWAALGGGVWMVTCRELTLAESSGNTGDFGGAMAASRGSHSESSSSPTPRMTSLGRRVDAVSAHDSSSCVWYRGFGGRTALLFDASLVGDGGINDLRTSALGRRLRAVQLLERNACCRWPSSFEVSSR